MNIKEIKLKIIKDSRGKDTLEAKINTQENNREFLGWASIPSGKSTGIHEAKALEPKVVLKKFELIRNKIINNDFRDQKEFDDFLIDLDGTDNKNNIGANLILSLSLSFARAISKSKNLELHQYINEISNIKPLFFAKNLKDKQTSNNFPHPIFNVINGGAHVEIPKIWNKKFGIKKSLDFQEFQIIPTTDDFAIGLSVGKEFYTKLGKELIKIYGKENVLLGDEAGYLCPFKTNEEALEMLQELINRNLYPLKIGLDVAASQFHNDADNTYLIEGEKRTSEELSMLYDGIIHRYDIVSLEDPFQEEAFDDFSKLLKDMPQKIIITDDLTTTNSKRLMKAISEKSGNAILIKLNQIGTLSETLEVIKIAYENNWKAIVSHRSGETNDDFIADLAVGVGAWGIKSGAPAKPERMAKYNRTLELWGRKMGIE